MNLNRKLMGALLLAVMFGYPAMACVSSAQEMTEAERECCKHMAEQCGSMNMPASHSCCQVEVRRPNSMLGIVSAHILAPPATDAASIDLSIGLVAGFSSSQLHAPSESPPGASSILRI